MEDTLRRTAWLAGDHYSLADIAAVPFVKRIDEEIAPDEMTAARHPRVAGVVGGDPGAAGLRRANIGPFV